MKKILSRASYMWFFRSGLRRFSTFVDGGIRCERTGDSRASRSLKSFPSWSILGILAAVAVPKYYDLQEEAQRKRLLVSSQSHRHVLTEVWATAFGWRTCAKAQAAAIAVATDDLGGWKYGTDNNISFTGDIATIGSMTNPAGTVITLTNAKLSQPSCTGGTKTD